MPVNASEVELCLVFEFHTPSKLTVHTNRKLAKSSSEQPSAGYVVWPRLKEALAQIEEVKLDTYVSQTLRHSLTVEVKPDIDVPHTVMNITSVLMEFFNTPSHKVCIEDVIYSPDSSRELIHR